MPIQIQCPNPACAASASVADSVAGRGVKCRKCGTPFRAVPTLDGQQSETKKSSPASAGDPFPTLPAEFGRYRVLRLLGRGGMGAVYLAEDSQLGRQVALKLPGFDAADAKRVERFVREARSAAGLMHPHICPVYDAGQIAGRPFITMAYIAGRPLDAAIDPDAPMDPRRAADVARKVAAALHEAHDKGIVHRDLKPANVMLNAKGDPVVMDFGLAKRLSEADPNEAKLTRDGAILGTPSYMAPEQVKGDRVGPGTDVYALGVLLFEMLTGRTPYSGTIGVVLGQILAAPVRRPSELRPGLDPRLDDACHRAMAKNPADRFPDMAAFEASLAEYLRAPAAPTVTAVDLPFGEFGGETEDDATAPVKRRRKKKKSKGPSRGPLAIAAGVAAFLLLVAGVVLTVRTKHGDVVIELSGAAAGADVKVDGTRIDVAGLDKPLSLTAGEHGLTVTGPDFETVAQSFTVKKGEKQVVKVTLKPKAVQATGQLPTPSDTPAEAPRTVPVPAPTPAATKPAGPANPVAGTDGFEPLFPGPGLAGWAGLPDTWRTADGVLVGKLAPGRNKSTFLCSQKTYTDFELRCRVRLKNGVGNSGIQVRSKVVEPQDFLVAGPQIEIDANKYGGLYPERTNGKFSKRMAEDDVKRLFKADEYNDYTIRCVGDRITFVLNGTTVVDEDFPGLDDSGIIAFQLHGGMKVEELSVKDAVIKDLSKKAAADGFAPLFNGKDLAGWTVDGGPSPWKVDSGELRITDLAFVRSGMLLTDKDYADFKLRLEFNLEAGADAGITLRQKPGEKAIKVNLLAGEADNFNAGTGSFWWPDEKGGTAGNRRADSPAELNTGEWHRMEIVAQGPRITVRINDADVSQVETALLQSKPVENAALARRTGRIGLQSSATAIVRFRNIEIRELPEAAPKVADGFSPLFNGKDLTGWLVESGDTQNWKIEDGMIKINASEPNRKESWLLSEKSYTDFLARFEFRTDSAAANSGFAIRAVPGERPVFGTDGIPFGVPTHLQIEILAATTDPNRKLQTGTVLGGLKPQLELTSDPIGKQKLNGAWNEMEIELRGQQIKVRLNGSLVLDRNLDILVDQGGKYPGLKRPAGRIGFQRWQGAVGFRNIVIHDLSLANRTADFIPLFNRKDLTGWRAVGAPKWTWEAGRAVGTPAVPSGAGYLLTDDDYDDLELELEYRLGVGAGSGLFLRADPNAPDSGAGQIEIQIIDDDFPQYSGLPASNKTGSVFNTFSRRVDPPYKRGDWNAMRVRLVKRQIQVWVNGVQTVDADLDSARDRFAKVPGLTRTTGRIGLQQNQKADVEFRDVRVKRLSGN